MKKIIFSLFAFLFIFSFFSCFKSHENASEHGFSQERMPSSMNDIFISLDHERIKKLIDSKQSTFLPTAPVFTPTVSDATFSCFWAAISAFIGITQAKDIWKSIVAGAVEDTIIETLVLMGRRTATIVMVAGMVYAVGECLGWWLVDNYPSGPYNPTDSAKPLIITRGALSFTQSKAITSPLNT